MHINLAQYMHAALAEPHAAFEAVKDTKGKIVAIQKLSKGQRIKEAVSTRAYDERCMELAKAINQFKKDLINADGSVAEHVEGDWSKLGDERLSWPVFARNKRGEKYTLSIRARLARFVKNESLQTLSNAQLDRLRKIETWDQLIEQKYHLSAKGLTINPETQSLASGTGSMFSNTASTTGRRREALEGNLAANFRLRTRAEKEAGGAKVVTDEQLEEALLEVDPVEFTLIKKSKAPASVSELPPPKPPRSGAAAPNPTQQLEQLYARALALGYPKEAFDSEIGDALQNVSPKKQVNFAKAKITDRIVIAEQVVNELAEQQLSNVYALFASKHHLQEGAVDALGLEVQVTTGKQFNTVEQKYEILKSLLEKHDQAQQNHVLTDVYQRFLVSLNLNADEVNALGQSAAAAQGLPFGTLEERNVVLLPIFNDMRKLENVYLLLKNVHQIDRARAELLGSQDAQALHKPFNTPGEKYAILSRLNQTLSDVAQEGGFNLVQAHEPAGSAVTAKKDKPAIPARPVIANKPSVAQRMADGELGSSGVYAKPKKTQDAPALPARETEEGFVLVDAPPTKVKPARPPVPSKPNNLELTPKEARAVEIAQAKAVAERTENDDIYRFERSSLYEDLVHYGVTRPQAESLVADLYSVKNVSSLTVKEQVSALNEVTREIRTDKLRPLYQQLAAADIGPDRANALLAQRLGAKQFNELTPGEFFQALRVFARDVLDKKNSDENIVAAARAASQAIEREKAQSRQAPARPAPPVLGKQEKKNLSHDLALAAAGATLKKRSAATVAQAPEVTPTVEVKPVSRRRTGANDLLAD